RPDRGRGAGHGRDDAGRPGVGATVPGRTAAAGAAVGAAGHRDADEPGAPAAPRRHWKPRRRCTAGCRGGRMNRPTLTVSGQASEVVTSDGSVVLNVPIMLRQRSGRRVVAFDGSGFGSGERTRIGAT